QRVFSVDQCNIQVFRLCVSDWYFYEYRHLNGLRSKTHICLVKSVSSVDSNQDRCGNVDLLPVTTILVSPNVRILYQCFVC
ncbi:hypothetical protein L9F63_008207, partial [Diploptera punctata]